MGVEELINSGKQAFDVARGTRRIGDLTFGSEEWVSVASDEMVLAVDKHKNGLSDLGEFVFCEVAHNPQQTFALATNWHGTPGSIMAQSKLLQVSLMIRTAITKWKVTTLSLVIFLEF